MNLKCSFHKCIRNYEIFTGKTLRGEINGDLKNKRFEKRAAIKRFYDYTFTKGMNMGNSVVCVRFGCTMDLCLDIDFCIIDNASESESEGESEKNIEK